MATLTLTLRDTDDGFITEEQFAQLPEPDLFCLELEAGCWIVQEQLSGPADGIVHLFVHRGGAFVPERRRSSPS